MANVTHNALVNRSSGKVGNMFFKTRGNKTFLCKLPDFSRRKLSRKQKECNSILREANEYARKAKLDSDLWKFYMKRRKGGQSAFNVAVRDYMTPPKIEKIDILQYKGEAGGVVRIDVEDLFEVKGVKVSIVDAAGIELEGGEAIPSPYYSTFHWGYEAKTENPGWQEGRFIVTIRDIPGNEVSAILERDPSFKSPSQTDSSSSNRSSIYDEWRIIGRQMEAIRRITGAKPENNRRITQPWWKFWR